jgi:hypothetical protein
VIESGAGTDSLSLAENGIAPSNDGAYQNLALNTRRPGNHGIHTQGRLYHSRGSRSSAAIPSWFFESGPRCYPRERWIGKFPLNASNGASAHLSIDRISGVFFFGILEKKRRLDLLF